MNLPASKQSVKLFFAGMALFASSLGGAAQAQDEVPTTPQPAAALPEGSVGGMGDINLFPKRVVIDGRRSIATIGLFNKTADDGDYEIKIVDMAMTPEGQLLNFDNGAPPEITAKVKTASPFLRYSPRRVTLRGSESQTIRIMARGDNELPDGEYRSHFLAVSVPRDEQQGFSIDDAVAGGNPEGIGVQIKPRFGISIPVIVRIGQTTLSVGIREAQLLTAEDGSQAVGLIITRAGTRSAFGDVMVSASGASKPVALSRGIGIYPEIDERLVIIPVDPELEPGTLASGRKLTITYTDDDFEPGAKLAEYTLVIP